MKRHVDDITAADPEDMLKELKETHSSTTARFVELDDQGGNVALLDVLIVLARGKWIWIASAAICGLAALGVSFLFPVQFQAETLILPPPQATSSTNMLLGQVGSLLGMNASSGLGMRDPNDVMLALLRSRTIADEIIKKFDLENVYGKHDLVLAELALAKRSEANSTLQGAISVRVKDRDPKRAAAIANEYIAQLYKQNDKMLLTEAAQRRDFFRQQMEQEKDALENSEVSLKETELKTGVIELQGQTELALRSVANLRAQITASQVQLKILLESETPGNPDVVRLQEQIRALQSDMEKVQGDTTEAGLAKGVTLPTSAVPSLALDYVRKLREVKYHESLFNLLERQYEAAKMDEAKEAPMIQVIDPAVPPHFKYEPKRGLMTAAGIALGLIIGWVLTLFLAMMRRNMQEPAFATKWSALRRAIRS